MALNRTTSTTNDNYRTAGGILDSFRGVKLETVEIRGIICSDNVHCWMPREGHVGKSSERSQSILIRSPGLRAKTGFGVRADQLLRTYECVVSGVLSRSYIQPFPVILGPLLSLRFLEGDYRKPVGVSEFSRLNEHAMRGIVAAEASSSDAERRFKDLYGQLDEW